MAIIQPSVAAVRTRRNCAGRYGARLCPARRGISRSVWSPQPALSIPDAIIPAKLLRLVGDTAAVRARVQQRSAAGSEVPCCFRAVNGPHALAAHACVRTLHPSSFIPHPSSLILHPSSFILHPSSFSLHPSAFSLQPPSSSKYGPASNPDSTFTSAPLRLCGEAFSFTPSCLRVFV
jgi:hypothetical protein